MVLRLIIAVLLELIYAITTRAWLPHHVATSPIELELLATAFRLFNAIVYWLLFRDLIVGRPRGRRSLLKPLSLAGLAILTVEPFLVGACYFSQMARFVFAATSLIVATKEEFLFRGVFQNLFERRWGLAAGIVLSNLLFIPYHIGAQPMSPAGIIGFFTMGSVFGLVYAETGSIILPIAMHAVYDALWFYTPILTVEFAPRVGSILQIAALGLFVAWARPRARLSGRP